jgi:hypothetical protein
VSGNSPWCLEKSYNKDLKDEMYLKILSEIPSDWIINDEGEASLSGNGHGATRSIACQDTDCFSPTNVNITYSHHITRDV